MKPLCIATNATVFDAVRLHHTVPHWFRVFDDRVVEYMIAGHRSTEPGHAIALAHLGLEPLLDLGMRLGEGTGGVVALKVVDSALAAHNRMATFAEADVSGPSDSAPVEDS